MNEHRQEIDLKELYISFMKHWWIVLSLMIVVTLTTYLITENVITPKYEADTTLFIGNEKDDIDIGISLNDLYRDSGLINDYKSIARTRLVIEKVLSNLNISMTIDDFKKGMDIYTLEDSRLFVVSFTSPDPKLSADVANELAKELSTAVFEIVGVENIRIIDPAILKEKPVSPVLLKNLVLGGLIGFVLGLIVNLILFLGDDAIDDKEQIMALINKPVLGEIPVIKEKVSDIVHVLKYPHSYASECYKMLRTNINYLNRNDNRTILFTSSVTSEGKTTTISNLAVTLSREKKKVLLLEGDLRRPQLHKRFKMSQEPGLVDFIYKAVDINSIIRKHPDEKNLHILTSGILPPMPDEVLGSRDFKDLIERLKQHYDYILIDAPPLLVVSDAMVLSHVVDEVVLVCALQETKKSSFKNTLNILEQNEVNFVGVIINKNKLNKKDSVNHYYDNYSDKRRR
jgi:capsular exopolysaccharide synthesis family protein